MTEIVTEPEFAIGQRALLVQTPGGNILWDCVSLIDDATIKAVEALGGIASLASSHPHMYGSMVEWSHAFGDAPIHLHSANERWVMRPDPVIEYWDGESHRLDQGVTLYRNYIPLSAPIVEQIAEKVSPLKFDRMYSHFRGLVISNDAKDAVQRSVQRYKKAIGS